MRLIESFKTHVKLNQILLNHTFKMSQFYFRFRWWKTTKPSRTAAWTPATPKRNRPPKSVWPSWWTACGRSWKRHLTHHHLNCQTSWSQDRNPDRRLPQLWPLPDKRNLKKEEGWFFKCVNWGIMFGWDWCDFLKYGAFYEWKFRFTNYT